MSKKGKGDPPQPPTVPPRVKTVGRTYSQTGAKAPVKKPAARVAPAARAAPRAESNKITKTQMVEMVADKTGLTKKQSEQAVSAAMEAIVNAIRAGQSVGLPGLGTLSVKATAARTGVRPGTREEIVIPSGKKVAFKIASTLKGNL